MTNKQRCALNAGRRPNGYRLVEDYPGSGRFDFDVKLYQAQKIGDCYAVHYGSELWFGMTYDEATKELGMALMHRAALNGRIYT